MSRSLTLSMIQSCPNLKKLGITIEKSDFDLLKGIFKGCQYLENIRIWSGGRHVIAKDSPKIFHKLKIFNNRNSTLCPKGLESFFIIWGKRIPLKPLIMTVAIKLNFSVVIQRTIIEKYKKMGILKEFGVKNTSLGLNIIMMIAY